MKKLIARYLPKARRGKRTAPLLLARSSRPIPPLPKNRPQPGNLDIAAPGLITNAIGAPAIVSAPAAGGPADPIGDTIAGAPRISKLGYARSQGTERARLAAIVEINARHRANRLAASRSTGREPPPGGWHIQIGATPNEAAARRLLSDAGSRAGDILGSLDSFTQPVRKNGAVLYRARFAGFAGKKEARAACANLKRRSIACLAVPN
jgi:hypothetical protein